MARDASEHGALVVAFDQGAGMLDEFAVFDGGGAGGFTGAAIEAFVDVLDERLGDLRASRPWSFGTDANGSACDSLSICGGRRIYRGRRRTLGTGLGMWLRVLVADGGEIGLGDVDHLVDAAARGVSLQIPKAIGRAGVETDAAVDAACKVFVCGILAGDWGSGGHLRRLGL